MCIYIYIYVCMYVCMNIYIYIYIYIKHVVVVGSPFPDPPSGDSEKQ